MKKLNLPIIKNMPSKKKVLSMDQYYAFVMFNLKHTVDLEAARKWKRMAAVNERFVIKD